MTIKSILNDRIKIEIEQIDDNELFELISLYWKTDEKGEYEYKVSDLGSSIGYKARKFSKVVFDKGLHSEKLIQIKNRSDLSASINFFIYRLNIEFDLYLKKSQEISIRKDIKTLFIKREQSEIKSKNKLQWVYENSLSRNYKKLERIERNFLLIIAELNTKDEIISVFRSKGSNWTTLNKLSLLGFVFIQRGFDKKIQDFIMDTRLKERLITYIIKKGFDIYNLEIHYM